MELHKGASIPLSLAGQHPAGELPGLIVGSTSVGAPALWIFLCWKSRIYLSML